MNKLVIQLKERNVNKFMLFVIKIQFDILKEINATDGKEEHFRKNIKKCSIN